MEPSVAMPERGARRGGRELDATVGVLDSGAGRPSSVRGPVYSAGAGAPPSASVGASSCEA